MLQNLLTSMLTPLQNVDELNCLENRPFTGTWPESKREKPTDIKKTIKKKPKRIRTAYTTEQLRTLETLFTENKYITSDRRQEISKALKIGDKSIKIWFQNRRMKEKREFSESSSNSSMEALVCELLSPPVPTDSQSQSQVITNTSTNQEAHLFSNDSHQYQVPPFYMNNRGFDQTQTFNANDNLLQSNGMQFYFDNNAYPTQYYPYESDNRYLNDYNYYQYQRENAFCNNYWSLNNVEGTLNFYN